MCAITWCSNYFCFVLALVAKTAFEASWAAGLIIVAANCVWVRTTATYATGFSI